ncbi:AMP-binding protein [Streptomyces olivochromogenes]|uniref:AMP-binding protein n=1 Tax=Streptomyces olivochromogenes TaxID=1963 RepID=UPI0027E54BF1|nr:AMP-binding protein [Streptomyces olivochromogenes]
MMASSGQARPRRHPSGNRDLYGLRSSAPGRHDGVDLPTGPGRNRIGDTSGSRHACSGTYAELDARSARPAGPLRARGVGTQTRVAVPLERGHELVTAVLAVLRAGGAHVPVDPGHPPVYRRQLPADAEASVVVTADDVRRATADRDPVAEPVPVDSRALAYVLFTSGSTGRPKGAWSSTARCRAWSATPTRTAAPAQT